VPRCSEEEEEMCVGPLRHTEEVEGVGLLREEEVDRRAAPLGVDGAKPCSSSPQAYG
jgi:hypothetical protein